MAFSQIATSVTIINSGLIGYNGISLTNFNTSALSAIAAGSGIEIAGAFFKADAETAVNASSWTAITTTNNAYLYLTPSGSAGTQIITASWDATAPVWSTSKQGWYASAGSSTRVIGESYKVSPTQQEAKTLYKNVNKGDLISGTEYTTIRIGYDSLKKNNSINNIGIGIETLYSNTTGTQNIAIGTDALYANTIGTNNLAVGNATLLQNTTGINNIGIGSSALQVNTTGINNIGIGSSSLYSNTTGINNIGIGSSALYSNTTGAENIAIGSSSLQTNTIGVNNIAIGSSSLYTNASGINNIAIGYNALNLNTVHDNIGIGSSALSSNTTGLYSVGIGSSALSSNTTGNGNTALGYHALQTNTVGVNNTAVGFNANNTTSSLSNIITLGDNFITTLRCNVTTITALSDERDKINIKDLSLGMEFVNRMHPIIFNWDKREWYAEKDKNGMALKKENNDYKLLSPKDGSKMGDLDYGFSAQELLVLQKEYPWLKVVNTDNENILETSSGRLFPILVKAVQELYTEVKLLKEKK